MLDQLDPEYLHLATILYRLGVVVITLHQLLLQRLEHLACAVTDDDAAQDEL